MVESELLHSESVVRVSEVIYIELVEVVRIYANILAYIDDMRPQVTLLVKEGQVFLVRDFEH